HSTTTTKRSSWAAEGARGRERAAPAARARAARGGGFARRERPPRRRPAQDRSESRADAGPHRRRSHEEPADDRLLPATGGPAAVGGLVSVRVLGAILLGAAIVAAPSFAAAQDADRAAQPSLQAGACDEAQARQQRYQIGVLERVLEGAVQHGVT